jgi:multidrug resistance efflux pump
MNERTARCGWASSLATLLACLGCSRGTADGYAGFVDAPVAAVAAPVSGQVAQVLVREGDHVKRDQLLVRLDSRERTALVAQAQANVEHAREALHEAEHNAEAIAPTLRGAVADEARQRAELDDALAEFGRAQRLLQLGASSQAALDAARARIDAARAGLDAQGASRQATRGRVVAALSAVRTAGAAVQSAEAGLELARVQLQETEIRSPFDGLIAEQNVQPGEWAAPGTPIVNIEDLGRQWVRIDVEETKLHALRLGGATQIHVVAFPDRRFAGHVIEIGAEGEFALNRDVKRGRPDVRTFRVRVGLDKVDDELRPGMTADVTLEAKGRKP